MADETDPFLEFLSKAHGALESFCEFRCVIVCDHQAVRCAGVWVSGASVLFLPEAAVDVTGSHLRASSSSLAAICPPPRYTLDVDSPVLKHVDLIVLDIARLHARLRDAHPIKVAPLLPRTLAFAAQVGQWWCCTRGEAEWWGGCLDHRWKREGVASLRVLMAPVTIAFLFPFRVHPFRRWLTWIRRRTRAPLDR